MQGSRLGQTVALAVLGILGWALCGALVFIGMAASTIETALVLHAIGAPIAFAAIAAFDFTRLGHASPLRAAIAILLVVTLLDFFVVALSINRSMEMFQSVLAAGRRHSDEAEP